MGTQAAKWTTIEGTVVIVIGLACLAYTAWTVVINPLVLRSPMTWAAGYPMMLLGNVLWFAVSSAMFHPPTKVVAGLTNLVTYSLVSVQIGLLLLAASHIVIGGTVSTSPTAWLMSLSFLLCAHLLALLDSHVHHLNGAEYAQGWYWENLLALGLIVGAIILCCLSVWWNKKRYGLPVVLPCFITTVGIGSTVAFAIMIVLAVYFIVRMFTGHGLNILGSG